MENIDLKNRLSIINWFGVAAGALMLILPFLGAWWRAEVGTGALEFGISPFYYNVSIMGESLTSSLVGYVVLAAQLTSIIGGALLIVGSLGTDQWWGKKLMRFGAMKMVWFVVSLVAVLLVGAFLLNNVLPGFLSNAGGGGADMQLEAPYLIGTSTSTIQQENVSFSAPISTSLTPIFWVAVLTAGLGVAARIYHGKLMKKLGMKTED